MVTLALERKGFCGLVCQLRLSKPGATCLTYVSLTYVFWRCACFSVVIITTSFIREGKFPRHVLIEKAICSVRNPLHPQSVVWCSNCILNKIHVERCRQASCRVYWHLWRRSQSQSRLPLLVPPACALPQATPMAPPEATAASGTTLAMLPACVLELKSTKARHPGLYNPGLYVAPVQ